jgi:hypothetical protein
LGIFGQLKQVRRARSNLDTSTFFQIAIVDDLKPVSDLPHLAKLRIKVAALR